MVKSKKKQRKSNLLSSIFLGKHFGNSNWTLHDLSVWFYDVCKRNSFFFFNLVDADEIPRLGKRFKKLDVDGSGSLSVQEFMSIPELQQNPLVQRVIDIFDTDGNGEIDFKGLSNKNIHFFIALKIIFLQNSLVEFHSLVSKVTKNQNYDVSFEICS